MSSKHLIKIHTVAQNNGLKMPTIGLGTYDNTKEEDVKVLKALIKDKVYAHIDTASFYNNEEQIGQALHDLIEEKAIAREDVYVTIKAFMWEMKDIEGALRRSLGKLKLKQVDLYLIHWPIQLEGTFADGHIIRVPMHKIWAEMERMVELGLAKSIGVSNFNFQLLNDLLSYAKIKPVCNQLELHPYLAQERFVDWMKANHIIPVAYTPLGKGLGDGKEAVPMKDELIAKIAAQTGKSAAQVILAWHLARGHVAIPKSANYDRAHQNAESSELKLSEEQVKEITHLNRNYRFVDNQKWPGPFKGIPMWE